MYLPIRVKITVKETYPFLRNPLQLIRLLSSKFRLLKVIPFFLCRAKPLGFFLPIMHEIPIDLISVKFNFEFCLCAVTCINYH